MARGRKSGGTRRPSSPIAASARQLDKSIAKAADKATKLRQQADELDASVEPLKAARDALGTVE